MIEDRKLMDKPMMKLLKWPVDDIIEECGQKQ